MDLSRSHKEACLVSFGPYSHPGHSHAHTQLQKSDDPPRRTTQTRSPKPAPQQSCGRGRTRPAAGPAPPAAATLSLEGHAGKPRAVRQRPLPDAAHSAPSSPPASPGLCSRKVSTRSLAGCVRAGSAGAGAALGLLLRPVDTVMTEEPSLESLSASPLGPPPWKDNGFQSGDG